MSEATTAAAAATEPAASAAAAAEGEEQVIARVKELRQEQTQLVSKIGELEVELSEHRVVVESMKKVEPSRRCYRLIGGVLVERTAGEVLPAVEQSRDNIEKTLIELQKMLAAKTKQLDEFMQQHKVRFVSEEEAQTIAAQEQLALMQQQQQRTGADPEGQGEAPAQ